MRCNAFDQRVNRLLDQRASLESDEQLRAHAEICPRCQNALSTHRQLLEILNDVNLPEPSVPPAQYRTKMAGWIAVAAILVVAFNLWTLLPGPQKIPAEVAVTPQVERPAELHPVASDQAVVVQNEFPPRADPQPYLLHQPLVGLRLLSMGDWSTTMHSISLPFGGEIPQVQEEWADAVAHGISPVQDSFTNTLNLIRRTLAAGDTHQS